jgi:hypothetical protein
MHPLEVDDHIARLGRELCESSHELLGRAEEKRPLGLEHGHFAAFLRQDVAFLRRAQTVRAHEIGAVIAPNDAPHIGAVVEHMQLELLGDLLADADAAQAVALLVDGRGINADADLPGDGGNDASRHPALGRHADLIRPFTGVIVHAAGVHHRQHVAHILCLVHGLAGKGVHAVIGECGGHDGEIAGRDADRALAEIDVEHLVRIAPDHAGVEHHIGDGAIAVAGGKFRSVHHLVDSERAAGETGEQREHVDDALVLSGALHQLGDGDGAGIDHGVERAVGHLVEHDRVERLASGLDADMLQHHLAAIVLQRVAIHEGFRYRLDGEGAVGVAYRIDLSIDSDDGNAEQGRIGLAEFGDIVGGFSVCQRRGVLIELRQIVFDRCKRRRGLVAHRSNGIHLVQCQPQVQPRECGDGQL